MITAKLIDRFLTILTADRLVIIIMGGYKKEHSAPVKRIQLTPGQRIFAGNKYIEKAASPLPFPGNKYIEKAAPHANNESSEVFDIIKPGRRVQIKGYRQ